MNVWEGINFLDVSLGIILYLQYTNLTISDDTSWLQEARGSTPETIKQISKMQTKGLLAPIDNMIRHKVIVASN